MFIDMNRAQNACYKANGWAISYETADTGYKARPDDLRRSPKPNARCSPTISPTASMLFKIPLAYPTTWDGSGTASHTEPFGYPYWTNSNGKICPGQKKKAQVRDVIIPFARAIVAAWTGTTPIPIPPLEEDDDMPTAQEVAEAVWGLGITQYYDNTVKQAAVGLVAGAHAEAARANEGVAALRAELVAAGVIK